MLMYGHDQTKNRPNCALTPERVWGPGCKRCNKQRSPGVHISRLKLGGGLIKDMGFIVKTTIQACFLDCSNPLALQFFNSL